MKTDLGSRKIVLLTSAVHIVKDFMLPMAPIIQ